MAEPKTQATKNSVTSFLNAIDDEQRRKDCKELVAMMTKSTKSKPVMWGTAIIGFGDHQYTGSNGKAVQWFQAGFSPRKAALSVYMMGGKDPVLLAKLGAAKMSGGCLHIKRLDDVHRPTLQKLLDTSVKQLKTVAKKAKGQGK